LFLQKEIKYSSDRWMALENDPAIRVAPFSIRGKESFMPEGWESPNPFRL
jgi:hypothetical protein